MHADTLPAAGEARPLLVSVHMPKTAGTSFSAVLRACYGAHYQADYGDLPLQLPHLHRIHQALGESWRIHHHGVAADCVHGHFLPAKYRFGLRRRRVIYVTWLRDPVERVVSHYHYWRRDYDGCDPQQPLRNRMLAERWTLERFALGPEMRNLYRQYLWNFAPTRFDFIGITEHYADDLQRLAQRHLDCDPIVASEQVNPERGGIHYPLDPALHRRIERHHALDVALYRWALSQRECRA